VPSCSLLALAAAIYLGVGTHDLSVPGLQHDEATDAVPAMQLLTGQALSCAGKIRILGIDLPLMMLHHIGPTTIYTSLLGFLAFGISVEALRLSQLAVGLVSLVLLWLLARVWFSDRCAALAALLCGSAPVFIWWNRAGANWTAPLLPIAIAMTLALTRWWRRRSADALALAAFLFGFGITTKILFVWLAVPLFLTAAATLRWQGTQRLFRDLGWVRLAACTAAFLLGLLPLLLYNWPTPHTLEHIASNAIRTRLYGHDNLAFASNLRTVGSEYLRALAGDTLAFGAPVGLPFVSFAYVISVAYLAARALHQRRLLPIDDRTVGGEARDGERTRLFLLLSTIAVVPLGTVSTSGIGATYLFLIFPFAYLTIAVAVDDGWTSLSSHRVRSVRRAGILVPGAIIVALLVSHIDIDRKTLDHFSRTGGVSFWSRANSLLAECLASKYADRPIVAMDWGFARSVDFLTLGALRMTDGFEYRPSPQSDYAARAVEMLSDERTAFVFHAPWTTAFRGYREVLEETAAAAGKRLVARDEFCEWNGVTTAVVMTACGAGEECFDSVRCRGTCGPREP
jgi:hypothetical protein